MKIASHVFLILVFAALASPVLGADVVLPVYTGDGAVTRPVIINPTSADVMLYPDSKVCDLTGCHLIPGALIKAGGRILGPTVTPPKGIAGVFHLALDPSLIAYSEIITGAGALFRVYPMHALDSAKFDDVSHDGLYNGFLFIAADSDTVISLFGHTQALAKDEGAVLATPADGKFEIVGQLGAPKFYVFAGINSQTNGSLQIVLPR